MVDADTLYGIIGTDEFNPLADKELYWFKEQFVELDDGDMQLDMEEFANVMEQSLPDIDASCFEELFSLLDADGSGKISWEEFTAIFYPLNTAKKPEKDFTTEDSDGLLRDPHFEADGMKTFGEGCDPTQGNPVDWKRAPELFNATKLFDGIEPNDVCQGGLGDCWLLAAISAMCEFPGAIESLFETNKISDDGKYYVRLYDSQIKKFVRIPVDDYVACMSAETMFGKGYTFEDGNIYNCCFTKPKGNEIWVPILEKAVAKFCGSFGALNGGQALYAWQLMSGATELSEYRKSGDTWQHIKVEYTDARTVDSWSGVAGIHGKPSHEKLHELLNRFDDMNYVMGCSANGGCEDKLDNGLISGHAFSLIAVDTVEGEKMVQIRNPWGNEHEWNGRFSDTWDGWSDPKYKKLKEALGLHDGGKPDGLFWMCWEDFCESWDTVSVAHKPMNTPRGQAQAPGESTFSRSEEIAPTEDKPKKKSKKIKAQKAHSAPQPVLKAQKAQSAKQPVAGKKAGDDEDGGGGFGLFGAMPDFGNPFMQFPSLANPFGATGFMEPFPGFKPDQNMFSAQYPPLSPQLTPRMFASVPPAMPQTSFAQQMQAGQGGMFRPEYMGGGAQAPMGGNFPPRPVGVMSAAPPAQAYPSLMGSQTTYGNPMGTTMQYSSRDGSPQVSPRGVNGVERQDSFGRAFPGDGSSPRQLPSVPATSLATSARSVMGLSRPMGQPMSMGFAQPMGQPMSMGGFAQPMGQPMSMGLAQPMAGGYGNPYGAPRSFY